MNTEQRQVDKSDGPVVTRMRVVVARVTWMMIGPLVLLVLLLSILKAGSGWATGLDAAFLAVVAAMIAGRWYELRSGQAATSDGRPATWDDFRRYVLILLPSAAAAWAVANLIGNHLLNTAG